MHFMLLFFYNIELILLQDDLMTVDLLVAIGLVRIDLVTPSLN